MEFGAEFDDPVVNNKATGAVTGTLSGLGTSATGLASATSLYVKSKSSLYEVDVTTGASTYFFDTGSFMHNMLENAPDGSLISGARTSGGTRFYSVDVGTQTTTTLGFSNVASSALAYQPMGQTDSEPAGIALAILAWVRRRKV